MNAGCIFTIIIVCIVLVVVNYRSHPFWSTRPGPHWYHRFCSPGIIRKLPAPIPPLHNRWLIPTIATVDSAELYATLLNTSYHLSDDYKHTYTKEYIASLLQQPGVQAIEVREDGIVVGFVMSRPLKATRYGIFSKVLKGSSPGGITLIDFLCVASTVRGNGLAEHLISWIDTIVSHTGRRVFIFEREGRPAPISIAAVTDYVYKQIKRSINKSTTRSKRLKVIDTILTSQRWDLVNESDIQRWANGDNCWINMENNAYWIVEDAFMCDTDGKTFGIVLAVHGDGAINHIIENAPWDYIIAPTDIVGDCSEWKPSSRAWLHVYNCIIPDTVRLLTS